MKYLILLLALLGCKDYEYKELWECGEVTATHYEPSHTYTVPIPDFETGMIELLEHETLPKWSVSFSCRHGQFTVEGSRFRHKQLWKGLKEGLTVQIQYKDVFGYDKETDTRTFVNHRFVNAVVVNDCAQVEEEHEEHHH